MQPTKILNDGLRKRRALRRVLAFSIVLCLGSALRAQQIVETQIIDTQKEYKVKAVYLYSFGRFTRWPTRINSPPSKAFTIGVVGTSPISKTLSKVARKRRIGNRAILVKQYSGSAEVKRSDCEILFITRSIPTSEASSLLARLRDSPVLTVAESDARSVGTVVNFILEGDSIHFELNLEEAQRKKLSMDARLLRQGRRMLPSDPVQGP